MQPNPTAETSGPRVPSLRFCIALQYRLPGRTIEPAPHASPPEAFGTGRFAIDDARFATSCIQLLSSLHGSSPSAGSTVTELQLGDESLLGPG
jgi:hypothetical protein